MRRGVLNPFRLWAPRFLGPCDSCGVLPKSQPAEEQPAFQWNNQVLRAYFSKTANYYFQLTASDVA